MLSLTAKSHKYTVVFFWASWCPHCMELISKMKPAYPELKVRGTEVFAVSLDENYEEWVHTLAESEIPWINVTELKKWDTQAVSEYNIRSTPTLFLLSGEMKIIGRYNSFEDLKSAISLK